MLVKNRISICQALITSGWGRIKSISLTVESNPHTDCWEVILDYPTGDQPYLPRAIIECKTGRYLKRSRKRDSWVYRTVPNREANRLLSEGFKQLERERELAKEQDPTV